MKNETDSQTKLKQLKERKTDKKTTKRKLEHPKTIQTT